MIGIIVSSLIFYSCIFIYNSPDFSHWFRTLFGFIAVAFVVLFILVYGEENEKR